MFSVRLFFKVDDKRIASGKDFDPFTGKLNNDKVFLLKDSQADELVKDLKDGQWTIENIEEKVKTLTLNRHLQLLLFSKRLQENYVFLQEKQCKNCANSL